MYLSEDFHHVDGLEAFANFDLMLKFANDQLVRGTHSHTVTHCWLAGWLADKFPLFFILVHVWKYPYSFKK